MEEDLKFNKDLSILKLYVVSKKRVCPIPIKWNKIWEILNYSPKHIPLILNGWSCSDIQKMKRLEEQIDYASKNKVMYKKLKKYLLKLKDDDWYLYKGDKPSNVSYF